MADIGLGFQTNATEREPIELSPSQPLPSWLRGELVRTGPALFELGPDSLAHWFDGLAKLLRLELRPNKIIYRSKLLQSQALRQFQSSGRLASMEFASRPKKCGLAGLLQTLQGPRLTDNGNVNILSLPDGDWLALTETTRPLRVNADLLDAHPFEYQDQIRGQVTTAHPWVDPKSGEIINLVVRLGLKSCYQFTSWNPSQRRRRLLASLPVQKPSYTHSFAVAGPYLILLESPLRVNPLHLRFSSQPYINHYHWHQQQSSVAWIINRETGRIVVRHELEPAFHFHVVNAWEESNAICIDLPLYRDASIVDGLRLDALRSQRPLPPSCLCRLILPLYQRPPQRQVLFSGIVELPGLHRDWAGRRHDAAFLASSVEGLFLDSLLRYQDDQGVTHRWSAPGCFPGEPLFVARPHEHGGTRACDDGVLLSVVLDTFQSRSFVAVLDATDLRELSRIYLPDVVPFSFHGQFRHGSAQGGSL